MGNSHGDGVETGTGADTKLGVGARVVAAVRWRGVLETLGVLAFFLAFGLSLAHGLARAGGGAPPYPPSVVDSGASEPSTWLIDGYNVLHAGILRGRDRAEWWTEPRRNAVMERVRRFDDARAELWVVFDGPRAGEPAPADDTAGPGPRLVFADSADDWLLAQVRAAEDPSRIAVVTADRQLADRARHRGAQVHSPLAFLARCPG